MYSFCVGQLLALTVVVALRTGWDWNFGFIPYGSWWRAHRRTFHQFFNSEIVKEYMPAMEQQIIKVLKAMLVTPDDIRKLTHL